MHVAIFFPLLYVLLNSGKPLHP